MRTKVKKLTSILLAVIMAFSLFTIAPITASAAISDDYEYAYGVLEDGTAEITYYYGSQTELEIPSEIDGYTVTSIGDYVFYHCTTSLTSVIIPNSVTSIGTWAFRKCTSLANATIGDSVTSIGMEAFEDCTSLTSITIPDSVTSIGKGAFEGCTSLASITIPNSVTSIGRYAFDDTLWYNNQPDGIVYAGKVAYKYKGTMPENTSIILKEGTKGIAGSAFHECANLKSITIPDGVISIGEDAFIACTSLKNVIIPNSVTSIGDFAFDCCYSLTSVTMGNSVTSIGESAFDFCESLASITIPDSVTSIGECAFSGCKSLTAINVDVNNPNYCEIDGVVYNKDKTALVMSPGGKTGDVVIPDGVTSIGDYAFSSCKNLKSITIPDSVTNIGDWAFHECTSLTSVIIPNSVTSIGENAFRGCESLASVTMGNSVTSIGDCAFYFCTSLTSVTIPDSVTSIGSYAFYGTSLASVTIPKGVTTIGEYAFGYYYENTDGKFFGFIINGYSDTAAETYANENGFMFVSLDNAVKDDKTDISVTIKNQAELSVEMLTDTESVNKANVALKDNGNLIALYDISLIKDGAPVQPDGTATVRIPTDNENAKVYRIEDDGTATDMNAVYSGGYMVFTTEHFSTYAIVVPNDVILGDANGDGEVNVLDVSTIQLHVAKMTAPEIVTEACDVDGDGDINVNDVSLLQMKIAKLIP